MSFANNLWNKEVPREAADTMRGINTRIANSHVAAVLEWEDRWTPISSIEDYQAAHHIWSFEEAHGYYLDGSS